MPHNVTGRSGTNVYVNTNLSTLPPLVESQSSFNNPITISLKGLNGYGSSNQIMKMNSLGTQLEWADAEGSNWTVSGSNIYPTSVGQVLINTTSNTNSRNLLVNGTADINGNLHFGNNNDIYIKAQAQNMRNYTGYTSGSFGSEHLFYVKQSTGIDTQIASIRTGAISNLGISNINSGNSLLRLYTGGGQTVEIINNDGGGEGGSPYLSIECQNDNQGVGTSDYYIIWKLEGSEKMRLTTAGLSNVTWRGNTIDEIYGGTGNTAYSTGQILYASASNTLSKLSIGSTNQVLTVIGGIPSWEDSTVPDLTTSTNFGTAVQTGTIKMGNSSGNSYTANIELFVSTKLSIFNTGNVEVARFTPASNTCDLSLFGGVLSNATIGANTQYLGTAITYNYGGTGLSSLTANKILQVNSSANGYNLVDLPTSSTQYWSSSSGVLSPLTSTDAIRTEASLGFRIGGASDYTALDYNQTTNVFALYNTVSNIDFFDYDGDNGYINWGTQASARMNFNNYILHGSGTAYPAGVGMPFGTIDGIYASAAYMKLITTDDLVVNEFNGSPGTGSSNIRCNSSSEIYFTGNKLRINTITADNDNSNIITSNTSYGWQFQGTSGRQISITGATSYYPFIGSSSSYPYVNHINNIGDAYRISGTAASNLKHEFFGRVGIQISSPAVPLHVASQSSGGGTFTSGFYARSVAAGGGFASNNGYQYWNTDPISIVCEGGGYFKTGYIVASDRRIKTNIEDVPDNLALEYVRNIPCRYYEYIDKTRGYDKTIGFIAQEVKKIFPLAVSIGEEIVPDVYKNITCIWTEKEDKFILSSPDLTNVSGIEYLFYGLCECQEDEERIHAIGNEDNTFTFDKKFDKVFCYGSEVKDFHRLSHEKLFTLNFSATQEIDKIQQQHIIEIETLKSENETIKNELTLIKELLTKHNIID